MRILLYIFLSLLSFTTFANGQLTTISNGIQLYSEYFQNVHSKFKGTIIFFNGSGSDLSDWKSTTLFQCAKQSGSVFLYDRSGLGKSPPNYNLSLNNTLTAKHVNEQLFTLLKLRHIMPPYLLIAHSYGAIYAGYFTLTNPNTVKGLILIDPAPRQFEYAPAGMVKHIAAIEDAKIKSSKDIYIKYGGPETEIIYLLLGFNESKQSIKKLGIINESTPVTILSSKEMQKIKPITEDWHNSQKQWLNKNYKSKILVIDTDHFSHINQPQQVCNALHQMLGHVTTEQAE